MCTSYLYTTNFERITQKITLFFFFSFKVFYLHCLLHVLEVLLAHKIFVVLIVIGQRKYNYLFSFLQHSN